MNNVLITKLDEVVDLFVRVRPLVRAGQCDELVEVLSAQVEAMSKYVIQQGGSEPWVCEPATAVSAVLKKVNNIKTFPSPALAETVLNAIQSENSKTVAVNAFEKICFDMTEKFAETVTIFEVDLAYVQERVSSAKIGDADCAPDSKAGVAALVLLHAIEAKWNVVDQPSGDLISQRTALKVNTVFAIVMIVGNKFSKSEAHTEVVTRLTPL